MNESLLYFLKVNLILSLFILFYWVVIRNETFFSFNRFILLGAITFAFLLPLLPGSMLPKIKNKVVTPLHQSLSAIIWIHPNTDSKPNIQALEQPIFQGNNKYKKTASGLSLIQIATIIYILVALSLFMKFIWQLLQVCRFLKGNETRKEGEIIYHRTNKMLPSFSFFQHLIINQVQNEKEVEQIIAHEKVHIKQWHMVDILLANLVQVALWINPFVWILNQFVRLNLEYIADKEVLKSGVDPKAYQINILTSCLNTSELELANLFTSSKIKLRIKMMNANKTPESHLYKYALILPLLLGTYFLINPVSAQQAEVSESTKIVQGLVTEKNTRKEVQSSKARLRTYDLIHGLADENDPTPLIAASLRGDIQRVKQLIDKGDDINQSVPGDGSPLIAAAKNGHEQIVFFLVEKGAVINQAVQGDGNPLIAAASNGHVQIVSFLVSKGAQVNAILPGDETALINASGRGHLDIVKYLILKGADVNMSVLADQGLNSELRSPLNQAVKFGHDKIASYLKERGAKK